MLMHIIDIETAELMEYVGMTYRIIYPLRAMILFKILLSNTVCP